MSTFKTFINIFLITYLYVFHAFSNEPVLIITSAYNQPKFIEWQYYTFRKFVEDNYEYVVFNDAKDPLIAKKIRQTCAKLDIQCFDIPQEIHDLPYLPRLPEESFHHPSVRNCNVVQYALNELGFHHEGIVAIFDSDLFVVKPFNFNHFMKDYHIAGTKQIKKQWNNSIEYFWIGLCFMNTSTMPNKTTINFNCGRINNVAVDAGGYTHYYLTNEKPRKKYIDFLTIPKFTCNKCSDLSHCSHYAKKLDELPLDKHQKNLIKNYKILGGFKHKGVFLHYGAGSNWNNRPLKIYNKKMFAFEEYIQQILKE